MNPIFRSRASSLSLGLLGLLAVQCLGSSAWSQYYQPYQGGAPVPNFGGYGFPAQGYGQPGYNQPNVPSYMPPSFQQPGYRPPMPNYSQPNMGYRPPQYTPPAYQQPSYQAPNYPASQQQNSPQPLPTANDDMADNGNLDDYAKYTEQAQDLYSKGQLSQSIELFEKAMAIAPDNSIPVVYNNLAAVYMRRGNYYHDHGKQDEQALNDYRKAYFYLDTAWPEGQERKPLHEKNRAIAKDNLGIAYRNLNINANDRNKHLELAKNLRMQGKFPEAIVEFSQAWDLNKKDAATAKTLGDLFTVVNLPEKSKKYYAVALDGAGSGGTNLAADDMLVQLGNAQYKTGEIDKAVVNFDKALAINPNNASAINQLEKIWLNEIKFNPSSVLGHANLGGVYQKKKQFDQAMQQYSAAESFADRDPKTAFETKKLIRLNMGTLFQAKKQYELAQKAYDTVLQVEPNHLQANFYKATLLEESGNSDGAIQGYNKVLSIDPTYKPAQDKMFALVKQQSDPTAGLKQYAERFANNATIQAQIGEEFHQRKDLENAKTYYQKALQLDPKLANAWGNLGAVYEAQGKDEDAAEAFQKAQALAPNNATFKEMAKNSASSVGYKAYQQAAELQQQGKTEEALAAYQKALTTSDTPDVRAAYGTALQAAGKLDQAIIQYQQAIAKDANDPDYHYYLGTAFHQQKDLLKAKAEYQKALTLKPGYTDAKQAIASIDQQTASVDLDKAVNAYNAQNYISALTLVNQAIAKNAQDAMAHYYKGLILDAQKKPTLSVQSYREAVKQKPDFNDAYYALGVALDTTKDTKGAKVAFEKFIQLSGTNDDDFVKYAKERVKALAPQTASF